MQLLRFGSMLGRAGRSHMTPASMHTLGLDEPVLCLRFVGTQGWGKRKVAGLLAAP